MGRGGDRRWWVGLRRPRRGPTRADRDKGLAGHLAALRRAGPRLGQVRGQGGRHRAPRQRSGSRSDHPSAVPEVARALVDGVLATGLVAGTANLVNLLDLRPGRASKAAACPPRRDRRRPAGGLVAGPVGATWP